MEAGVPGLIVTVALLETATEEIVAPRVIDPLVTAVNVAV
jgi:hypothetical protein